jgi:hypothetical protein
MKHTPHLLKLLIAPFAILICSVDPAVSQNATGTISASPSKITLTPGGPAGATTISWTTANCAAAQVTVSTGVNGTQSLVWQATSSSQVAPWIGIGTAVFRLYGDLTQTKLLATVEVVGTFAPLTVQSDGSVRLNNFPYQGFAVNYFDAFDRVLWNVNDTSYTNGFLGLAQKKLPFARLDLSGYSPIHANLFFTDQAEYFRRLDAVVASAAQNGVGLIPSFFWTIYTFSDLAGEHLDQLANSNSITRQKMRQFTTAVVNRYKSNPAIWAWEFGNEWNLAVDLPNATQFLPPTDTSAGNPATRDPVRDILTTGIVLPALQEYANLVRSLDPGRPISSGHAIPRLAAWHMDQWQSGLQPDINQAWTLDTPDQARIIAKRHNPAPFDLLSIRAYSISEDIPRIPNYAQATRESKQALFVGEFGVVTTGSTTPQADYQQFLNASRVAPLVAMWVYDYRSSDSEGRSATTTNSRTWMLDALAQTPAYSENLESYTIGSNLGGQGGWTGTATPRIVTNTGYGNTSKVISNGTTTSTTVASKTVSPVPSSSTTGVLSFDILRTAGNSKVTGFGLGNGSNGVSFLNTDNEFYFRTQLQQTTQTKLTLVDGTTFAILPNKWYRFTASLDFTTNKITAVYVKNITDNAAPQQLFFGAWNATLPYTINESLWTQANIRTGTSTNPAAYLDNFKLEVQSVPR